MSDPTITVNLIPPDRRRRRLRDRAMLGWAGVLTIAGVLTTGLCVWAQFVGGSDARGLRDRMRTVSDRTSDVEASIQTLNVRLAEARRRSELASRLTDRPDWSLLLALIDAPRPAMIMLDRVTVTPSRMGNADPRAAWAAGDLDQGGPYTLMLVGRSPDQRSVLDYVLGLEDTGFFDVVRPVETAGGGIIPGSGVRFGIEAVFGSQASSAGESANAN